MKIRARTPTILNSVRRLANDMLANEVGLSSFTQVQPYLPIGVVGKIPLGQDGRAGLHSASSQDVSFCCPVRKLIMCFARSGQFCSRYYDVRRKKI